MVTIAIRLDPETKRKLTVLSKATGYQPALIVAEGVRRFVENEYAALVARHEQEMRALEAEGTGERLPPHESWNIVV